MTVSRPLIVAICLLVALPGAAVTKPGHGTGAQADHAGTPLTAPDLAGPARAPQPDPSPGGGASGTTARAIPVATGAALASILLLLRIRGSRRHTGPVRTP